MGWNSVCRLADEPPRGGSVRTLIATWWQEQLLTLPSLVFFVALVAAGAAFERP
jgi:hypothetical protein